MILVVCRVIVPHVLTFFMYSANNFLPHKGAESDNTTVTFESILMNNR